MAPARSPRFSSAAPRLFHASADPGSSRVARRHASAAMDVSDGLAGDLAKMLGAGRSARIAVGSVPLSEAAARACTADPGLIDPVLTGGDDYEILCTAAPEKLDALRAEAAEAGVPLTAIGTVTLPTIVAWMLQW